MHATPPALPLHQHNELPHTVSNTHRTTTPVLEPRRLKERTPQATPSISNSNSDLNSEDDEGVSLEMNAREFAAHEALVEGVLRFGAPSMRAQPQGGVATGGPGMNLRPVTQESDLSSAEFAKRCALFFLPDVRFPPP